MFSKFLKDLPNILGHKYFSFSFKSIFQLIKLSNSPSTCKTFSFFKIPIPLAARSLATPLTPKQSPLLGVISISITGSFKSSISATGNPSFVPTGNSIIPSCLSDMISSFSEQSMPLDGSPLILPFFKVKFKPGTNVPTFAKTPIIPDLTLGAPQTT